MDIVSQLISQPWALPVLVGVAALLLGLLIPRRGGASWISGLIFFLPNLFLDLLDVVHTKKFKYYGLITALLAIEAFFAFRAATVYYDVLNTHMPPPEMVIVCVIVFIAVFLCGYMVATHGKLTFKSGCTMAFVIFHDWTGTFWMNYSKAATASTGATIVAPDDPLKLALTIGMCVLGLLPFIMGAWAEELRPQLEAELEEEVDAFTSTATRKIKRRAVESVLRLANHTNVVHLVRALPADEFLDFKKFVMPIIAPGTPYNLPEQMSDKQPQSGQNGDSKDRQDHAILAEEKLPKHVPNDQPKTRQDGSQNGGQNGSQKPASQATKRDAKIRQFAAENPAMTRAKMAKRFGVSTRTLARILAGQKDMPQQPKNGMSSMPTNQAPVSTNGHHQMADRDTEKLESVSVGKLTLAHRN